ncbi:hypothetical protein WMY93_006761 [Mugilogobius chulae]|uniref:C2H2-type domain-containing protein n=1 Tax=Mugilogobius chulae TaxID=88201 RepID=A0AAW0PNF4_9GOBI
MSSQNGAGTIVRFLWLRPAAFVSCRHLLRWKLPKVKEEPEPSIKQEPEEIQIVIVKTEADEDKSCVFDPKEETGAEDPLTHSDSEEHTDSSEVAPLTPKRSYAMIPPDAELQDHTPYSCSECGRSFKKKAYVRQHMLSHSDERPHKCPECGKTFKMKKNLKLHMMYFSEARPYSRSEFTARRSNATPPTEKPHKCSLCPRGFPRKDDLNEHLKTRHHMCTVCDEIFPNRSKLKKHLRSYKRERRKDPVLPPGPVFCSICGAGFVEKSDLSLHMRSHGLDKPHPCSFCELRFYLECDLTLHRTQNHPVCRVCGEQFVNHYLLRKHADTHLFTHSCSECGQKFKSLLCLNKHKANHALQQKNRAFYSSSEQRSYSCLHCGQSFSCKLYLDVHMEVHKGQERELETQSCSDCGKSLKNESQMLIHSGQKRRQCLDCWKAFMRTSHLKEHEFLHSQQQQQLRADESEKQHKVFSCSECGKTFPSGARLKRHAAVHSCHVQSGADAQKLHRCSDCGKSFSQETVLQKHKLLHSRKNPENVKKLKEKRFALKRSLKNRLTGRHHTCSGCDSTFPDGVKEHVRSGGAADQSVLKPYSCSEQKGSLHAHRSRRCGGKPHECRERGGRFGRLCDVKRHMSSHGGEKPYRCSVCGRSYEQKGGLAKHFRQKHVRPGSVGLTDPGQKQTDPGQDQTDPGQKQTDPGQKQTDPGQMRRLQNQTDPRRQDQTDPGHTRHTRRQKHLTLIQKCLTQAVTVKLHRIQL